MMKRFLLGILLFLLILELGSIAITRALNLYDAPSYVINTTPKGLDLNETFGVWHLPNTKFIHKQDCIDVSYEFNSYGSRDFERNKTAKDRWFVIGDSMIEGYGIDSSERINNILERDLNREFLNFGTAGGFGSVQMYLMYKFFKDDFEHDNIIVALFPTNDFSDNSYEYGTHHFKKRYRPYLIPKQQEDSFELVYYIKNIEDSNWSYESYKSSKSSTAKHWFYEFTHIGAIMKALDSSNKAKNKAVTKKPDKKNNTKESIIQDSLTFDKTRYAHSEYLESEFNILVESIKLLKDEAGERSVYVLTIPSKRELLALKSKKIVDKLSPRLKTELDSLHIHHIDIISPLVKNNPRKDIKDLYLECDGHLSGLGNKQIADIIKEQISI